MEDPVFVDVELKDGVDQNSFVSEFDSVSEVELSNLLSEIPNFVVFKIEKTYLSTLQSHSSVKTAQIESIAMDEVTYPSPSARFTLTNKSAGGGSSSSASSTNAEDYISLQHYHDSDLITTDSTIGNHPNDDFYNTGSGVNTQGDWSSVYMGRYVDIVSIEGVGLSSNLPDATYDGYHSNHPDCKDPIDNSVKTIPVDWSSHGLVTSANTDQVNFNRMFNDHAFSTASVSTGKNCGFAKRARFYVMYLNGADGITDCCNAVLSWHNAKSVESATGLKRATLVCTEWHHPVTNFKFSIKVEDVLSVTDPTGGTTTRPSGGWGSDLTPFVSRHIIPRMLLDPTNSQWHWVVSVHDLEYGSSIHDPTNGQGSYRSSFTTLANNGIPVIGSLGNAGGVFVKDTDARSLGTYFDTNSNVTVYEFGYNSSGQQNDPGTITVRNSGSVTRWYPLRPYGNGGNGNTIDVAAGGNSETSSTLDHYSSRGPGMDLIGRGSSTWSAGGPSGVLYQDGYRWTYYGGTSCAKPTVAGKAACYMEKHQQLNGTYPTPAELRDILIAESRPTNVHAETVTWDNVPTAGDSSMGNNRPADHFGTLSGGRLYLEINQNRTHPNGGCVYIDHIGTPNNQAFFNSKGYNREQTYKERPREGVMYPRPRKFDLDINSTDSVSN